MEVWAELAPSKSRGKLVERASRLRGLVDCFNVPEAPLGRPKAHAIAVAHVVSEATGVPVVANLRLLDVNANGLVSLANAARLLGLRGLVLLRGDPPAYGRPVKDVGTEEAVRLLAGMKLGLQLGVILSLAYPPEAIASRLSLPLDFVLVTRMWKPEQLMAEPIQAARGRGVRVIPYIVVAEADQAREVYEMLKGHQPVYEPEEAGDVASSLVGVADGVLVSSPLSEKALVEAVRSVRERLSTS